MEKTDVKELLSALNREKTKSISLSNKGIEELPEDIGEFYNLESIDLSFNSITEIPEEIWNLKRLKSLLLFRNEIEELPKSIENLQNLKLIDVSYNQISRLPKEIGKLSNLETLDISYNKLRTIPLEVSQLLNLKKLYLENNPLEFPSIKVIKRGLYATMFHLAEEMRKRNATKVLVQIYNMPEEIQGSFNQYINCFNDIVTSANKDEVKFDLKYINHELTANIELGVDVEKYLMNFIKFVKENIKSIKPESLEDLKINILDLQVVELKNEIENLNDNINRKIIELKSLQNKMDKLSKILEK